MKTELNHRTICSMRSKAIQPEVQQRSNRSPLLLQQRELRWDQQRQVRHSVTTNFGHQLCCNRRFGDKIQNKIFQSLFHIIIRAESQVDGSTKTELNALGAHDVTEIFHHFTTKIHREVQSIRITFWICSWLGDRLGPDGQNTSKMILDDEDPYLTTGSPPCDPLSILQGLSQGRMDPEKFQARLKEGKEMLETSCSIYKQRIKRSISYMNIRSQQSRGKKRPVRGRMWRS